MGKRCAQSSCPGVWANLLELGGIRVIVPHRHTWRWQNERCFFGAVRHRRASVVPVQRRLIVIARAASLSRLSISGKGFSSVKIEIRSNHLSLMGPLIDEAA